MRATFTCAQVDSAVGRALLAFIATTLTSVVVCYALFVLVLYLESDGSLAVTAILGLVFGAVIGVPLSIFAGLVAVGRVSEQAAAKRAAQWRLEREDVEPSPATHIENIILTSIGAAVVAVAVFCSIRLTATLILGPSVPGSPGPARLVALATALLSVVLFVPRTYAARVRREDG